MALGAWAQLMFTHYLDAVLPGQLVITVVLRDLLVVANLGMLRPSMS